MVLQCLAVAAVDISRLSVGTGDMTRAVRDGSVRLRVAGGGGALSTNGSLTSKPSSPCPRTGSLRSGLGAIVSVHRRRGGVQSRFCK
eukprot:m.42318 g.42318  ORF g.42318 m.42318 type:complete len:87 (-) comp10672_c0_seq3:72-332(-)